LEGAIADLEILREADSASPQALATLGALYLEIGLPRDALEILHVLAEADGANAAVLYNAGRATLETRGDEGKAMAYLERSVALHPISPAARLLGLRRGAQGKTVEAYRLLGPWALANPEDHEARLAAAAAALKLERLPAAEELLRGLDRTQSGVRLLGADLALKQRDPSTAADLLEPLAATAPAEMEADVLVLLSTAWLELGRSGDVLKLLTDKTNQRPRLALALARAHNQGGDPQAAIATLDPFVQPILVRNPEEMPPGPARALMGSITRQQGRLLLAVDQPAEAVALLERSALFEPFHRETWQELARALAATGEIAKAEASLERFRELAEARKQAEVPGLKGHRRMDDTTGRRLAEALEWSARGEKEKALDIVRQEISLTPQDPRPRLLEIRTLLTLGRASEARRAADRTVEAFPELPDAKHFRAVAFLAEGDLRSAEDDLRQVLLAVENHLPAQNDLALVLARQGDLVGARKLLEEILAAHPDDSLARQRLADLESPPDGGGA
jgi:tetratricopeptide (TPR) repeat protein